MPKTIGVLALQGGYDPHARAVKALRAHPVFVRVPEDLEGIDGLIIPGGESTTIGKLLVSHGLLAPLQEKIKNGLPVFGTCAGMILLAKEVEGSQQTLIGALDIAVRRNAYGRQIESFEAKIPVNGHANPVPGIFIRAPQILRCGPGVETLATYEDLPVCVRQGALMAASFHPELTRDLTIHRIFLSSIK